MIQSTPACWKISKKPPSPIWTDAMTLGHIQNVPTEAVAVIVAGLVREGVTFIVTPENDSYTTWNVELTGGH